MKKSVLIMSFVFSLFIISIAFGVYDPQTGRFLQRDSLGTGPMVVFAGGGGPRIIGTKGPLVPGGTASNISQFIDGMNLYEYVKSNPIMLTDPTGGCSSKDPHGQDSPSDAKKVRDSCKCFCIESFNFDGRISNASDAPFYGGFIDLEMKGKWVDFKDKKPGRDGQAEVHWWEWYTTPGDLGVYDDPKHKTRQWNDLMSRYKPVPFQTVYNYSDRPGVQGAAADASIDQEAYIVAAAKTHKDCPCPYSNQMIFTEGAFLRLKGTYDSGGMSKDIHKFQIYHDTTTMKRQPTYQQLKSGFGTDRF